MCVTALPCLLQAEGYNVTAAEDGFGALLQLRKAMPDVIVSDLNMPRMSGFELLALVRRRFPRIVLLAMSGAYRNNDELPPEVIVDGFYAIPVALNPGRLDRDERSALGETVRSSCARVSKRVVGCSP
jgi:CheY-like chemotaxis protein